MKRINKRLHPINLPFVDFHHSFHSHKEVETFHLYFNLPL